MSCSSSLDGKHVFSEIGQRDSATAALIHVIHCSKASYQDKPGKRGAEFSVNGHSNQFLLGDIGGTHARFALLAGDKLGAVEDVPVASYPHIAEALRAFLARQPEAKLAGAVLAGAGPVYGNRCVMTNSSWIIDGAELQESFDLPWVQVINDFEALAWSLPDLAKDDLFTIGGKQALAGAPAVVLGPGTGLGVACLVHASQGLDVIVSEGGHATLPGTSKREDAVIEHLRSRFGHVSAERALSGSGLVNLYEAIASLDGISVPKRTAAAISSEGVAGSCPTSRAALELFCALLGTFAGDAALIFGARGGVYVAGGVVPHFLEFLARSQFRARFEAKGRLDTYVRAVPVHVITHADPAFVGLAFLARELSRRAAS
jgi:glucokinase